MKARSGLASSRSWFTSSILLQMDRALVSKRDGRLVVFSADICFGFRFVFGLNGSFLYFGFLFRNLYA